MPAQLEIADAAFLQNTPTVSQKREDESQDPKERTTRREGTILLKWLLENVPEYQRLSELREEVVHSGV